MVQGGEEPGFALEAGEPLGIRCESLRQELERDVAAEPGVGAR
jgi:hypothetical protein